MFLKKEVISKQMGLKIIRALFILISSIMGYFVAYAIYENLYTALIGSVIGIILSFTVISLERSIMKLPLKVILGGFIGLVMGLIAARYIAGILLLDIYRNPTLVTSLYLLISVIIGYLGLSIGVKKGEEVDFTKIKWFSGKIYSKGDNAKILDTSAIIDGRIADICEVGFLEGALIIPQFILKELQHIADSSDSIKRARGRRGLEILQRLQKLEGVEVRISDHDFPKHKDVDTKLVSLAKKLGVKIITNDYNLNKVAELQGVSVLNINQLANALKPVVLPGEVMNIKVLKEGKEHGQGVGYLDDGTMVVVDNAKKYMGKNVEVAVTSVLQTSAGRMIFCKLKDELKEGVVGEAVGN